MTTAIHYRVHTKPAKGDVLTEAQKKNFTVHTFSRTTRKTGCNQAVAEGDQLWRIDWEGKDANVNCARCLKPEGGDRKPKVAKAKKAGKGKGAAKKAAQPITTGTAVPKERMKELKNRAKASQAGTPLPPSEDVVPDYDPTADSLTEYPDPLPPMENPLLGSQVA